MGAVPRSVPLFNLGRQDLPWVVLLGVFSAAVALILRSSQGEHPQGRHAWKDLLVILGTLTALVMCVLAVLKIVCSYFSEPLNGLLGGYTQLEEGSTLSQKVETTEVRPQMAAAPLVPERLPEPSKKLPVPEAPLSSRSYRASYTPREEDDIECGLLLEASAVDFEYNGVRHQKGSLRVIKVERDGVCEVHLRPAVRPACVCFAFSLGESQSLTFLVCTHSARARALSGTCLLP
jgi:hypothetical protein